MTDLLNPYLITENFRCPSCRLEIEKPPNNMFEGTFICPQCDVTNTFEKLPRSNEYKIITIHKWMDMFGKWHE